MRKIDDILQSVAKIEFTRRETEKMVHELESSGELQGGEARAVVAAEDEKKRASPLMALNHVSRLCMSVEASVEFYTKVLGFVTIHRPPTLGFDGAWYATHPTRQALLLAPSSSILMNDMRALNVRNKLIRLFNYGVGIHLVQDRSCSAPDASADRLDPMDNHISFQVRHTIHSFM